jgi:two-component system response regulator MprA
MIVDDDSGMRRSLSCILEAEGYRVECGETGADAIVAAGRDDIAIFLVDVRMPGVNGLEACTRIKAQKPAVPVFLISAHVHDQAAAQAASADGLLFKPFRIPDLLALLAERCPPAATTANLLGVIR